MYGTVCCELNPGCRREKEYNLLVLRDGFVAWPRQKSAGSRVTASHRHRWEGSVGSGSSTH